MAEELDDGEFWLPPKFLCDEDLVMELTRPNSDTSSPGESSDEDDYLLLGLTRRFGHLSSLSDDFSKPGNNKWSSTSPQSTLYNQGSSPVCTSPLLGNKQTYPYGLLNAAAGQVAKIRHIQQPNYSFSNTPTPHCRPPNKPSPVIVPTNNSNQTASYRPLQVNQKKQQQGNLRRGQQQMSPHNRAKNASNGRPLGLSPSAWPTLQQSRQPQHWQPGFGMRAIFLQNPGTKPKCLGTGVFLPRTVGAATQTLDKPACLTVLVPDRVVQASKLNLNTMDVSAQPQNRSYTSNAANSSSDYVVKHHNRVLMAETQAQHKWNAAASRPQAAPISNEVQLPQEWTY